MPFSPLRPCRRTGCPELTSDGLCAKHLAEARANYDRDKRPDRHKLYTTAAWRKLARWKRNHDPLCEVCKTNLATMVHHIQPIESYPELAMHIDNLQSICASCHSSEHAATSFKGKPLTGE